MDSTGLEGVGEPGSGRWVTMYPNAEHGYNEVAGIYLDTAAGEGNPPDPLATGPRWSVVGTGRGRVHSSPPTRSVTLRPAVSVSSRRLCGPTNSVIAGGHGHAVNAATGGVANRRREAGGSECCSELIHRRAGLAPGVELTPAPGRLLVVRESGSLVVRLELTAADRPGRNRFSI